MSRDQRLEKKNSALNIFFLEFFLMTPAVDEANSNFYLLQVVEIDQV